MMPSSSRHSPACRQSTLCEGYLHDDDRDDVNNASGGAQQDPSKRRGGGGGGGRSRRLNRDCRDDRHRSNRRHRRRHHRRMDHDLNDEYFDGEDEEEYHYRDGRDRDSPIRSNDRYRGAKRLAAIIAVVLLAGTCATLSATVRNSNLGEDDWISSSAVMRRRKGQGQWRSSSGRSGIGLLGSGNEIGDDVGKGMGSSGSDAVSKWIIEPALLTSRTTGNKSGGDGLPQKSFKQLQPPPEHSSSPPDETSSKKKKTKRWLPCGIKYELERHDHEPRHGDICRARGGLMGTFECPPGCHDTGGPPPYCALGDANASGRGGGPCRAINPDEVERLEYRCDGDACVMAYGTPKSQFKGVGKYRDEDCGGVCGNGRIDGVHGDREWKAISTAKDGGTYTNEGNGSIFKCASDWDCSLSGICLPDGTCNCDGWADGVDCSYLKFQPVDKSRLGYLHDRHSSWGGSVVAVVDAASKSKTEHSNSRPGYAGSGPVSGAVDIGSGAGVGTVLGVGANNNAKKKEYRMYLSEIICPDSKKWRCGLSSWQTHSRIVVATSSNIDGPYRRNNDDATSLILPPEHHNPTLIVDKSTFPHRWHLYTISGPTGPIERITSIDEGKSWSPSRTLSSRQNPAPLLRSDGSTWLYYRADGMDLPSPTCSDEGISMVICPPIPTRGEGLVMNGVEESSCADPTDVDLLKRTGEDPSVFVDHRGNYHMLFNAHPYKCVPKAKQGGHAWSRDGIHWTDSPRVGAFDTTIHFTDGTAMTCERRERPQMIMDSDDEHERNNDGVNDNGEGRRPLALVSAVTGCPRGLTGGNRFSDLLLKKGGDGDDITKGDARHYKGGDDCFTLMQKMGV